jgi:hypothetical protein
MPTLTSTVGPCPAVLSRCEQALVLRLQEWRHDALVCRIHSEELLLPPPLTIQPAPEKSSVWPWLLAGLVVGAGTVLLAR